MVARINAKSPGLTSSDIAVRIADMSVPATAIETGPDVPRIVAIVIDAGPGQAKVMSKERELAVAPIIELPGASTTFTIDGAGILSKTKATRLDRSVAVGNDRHDVGRPTFEDFPAPSCDPP